ncbi:MAG: hypothetical protein ABFQ95_01195 [Pseudomonadota bacterium]
MITYRDFHISCDHKPIAMRCIDWEYAIDGYDGAPDAEDYRYGTAESLEEAKQAIDDWYLENESE